MASFLETLQSHPIYAERRKNSLGKFENLLKDAEERIDNSEIDTSASTAFTVFAAGSYGRLEAGKKSDLDLFLVANKGEAKESLTKDFNLGELYEKNSDLGKLIASQIKSGKPSTLNLMLYKQPYASNQNSDKIRASFSEQSSSLTEYQNTLVLAEIIKLRKDYREKHKIKSPENKDKRLKIHEAYDLIASTGTDSEDFENHFTTRLLLLLESRPLFGFEAWERSIDDALSMYFRDTTDHEQEFIPSFLLNDILRYWRTLCLNYEHTRSEPWKDWRLKSLSLVYSRKITIFCNVFAIVLSEVRSKEHIKEIIIPSGAKTIENQDKIRTPLERLAYALDTSKLLKSDGQEKLLEAFSEMLDAYENFILAKQEPGSLYEKYKELKEESIAVRRFFSKLYINIDDESLSKEILIF